MIPDHIIPAALPVLIPAVLGFGFIAWAVATTARRAITAFITDYRTCNDKVTAWLATYDDCDELDRPRDAIHQHRKGEQ